MSQARPLVVRLGVPLVNPQPVQSLLEAAGGTCAWSRRAILGGAIAAMRDADIVINAGSAYTSPPR